MFKPARLPVAFAFRSPHYNRTRLRPSLVFALTSVCALGYACKAPNDLGPESRLPSIERTILPDTGDSFYVRGGTLTSSGGFFLSTGGDTVCGLSNFDLSTGVDSIQVPAVLICGPSSLDAERRVVLDGGYVEIEGAVNADTTDIGPVDGSWDQEMQLYNPTVMTAVLTAHPFSGYHFANWYVKTVGGALLQYTTSLTVTRTAGSTARRFEAYFEQNGSRSLTNQSRLLRVPIRHAASAQPLQAHLPITLLRRIRSDDPSAQRN